ncbi:MAG: hypothetical protein FJ104_15010, partial [Deltaproteobacteria bacterium]|nr:hypothetical protein [Deltaproteobacteria bacterium]
MRVRNSARSLAVGLGVAGLIAAATFSSVANFDFAYDDHWTIVANRGLERPVGELLSLALRGEAHARGIPDGTRPMMLASVWFDRRVGGPGPTFGHLHSLALHTLATVLAGLAAFALSRRRRVAVIAALFFGVAPLHAEVVGLVNYREDLLAALGVLGFLTPLFWPWRDRARWSVALLSSGALLAALFAKESALAALALAPALAVTLGKGAGWFRARRAALSASVLVAVLWGVHRAWLTRVGADDVPRRLEQLAPVARVLRGARYLASGVAESVVPLFANVDPEPLGSPSPLWAAALGLVVAAVLELRRRRPLRPVAAGLVLSLLAPLGSSPLVGPVNERADRYLYVAVLGGGLLLGGVIDRALRRVRPPARAAIGVAGLAAL